MAKPALRVLRTGKLWFDGKDDYVSCGSGSSLELSSGFTLMGRFKFEPGISGGKGFVHKGLYINDYDYMLYLSTLGRPAVYFKNPSGNSFSATGSVDVRDGLWHHWAGTFDGRYLRMYVDGALVGETDTGGTTVRTTTSNLRIGYGYNGYTKMLADEVRIYNRVLTDSEISEIYIKGTFIKDGLVLCLPFYEGEGNIAHDMSGYNNHGTIYGDPMWIVKKALVR